MYIDLVWQITIILTLISIAIFNILIIIRFFSERRKNYYLKRAEEIKKTLFVHISNPLKNLKAILLKNNKELPLLVQTATQLLRILKGASRQVILEELVNIGIDKWLQKNIYKSNKKNLIAAINLSVYFTNNNIQKQLITLLNNSHYLVRCEAAKALAATQDPEIFDIIVNIFKKDQSFSYPLICDVFQKFGINIATQLVSLTKSGNISARIKMAALMALAKFTDTRFVSQTAIPFCSNKNNKIRAIAFFALSHSQKPIPDYLLKQGQKDPSWQVRQYVAKCAAYSFPASADILLLLLKDKNWLVGLESADALFSSGIQGQKLLNAISKNKSLAGSRARTIISEKGGEYAMA